MHIYCKLLMILHGESGSKWLDFLFLIEKY